MIKMIFDELRKIMNFENGKEFIFTHPDDYEDDRYRVLCKVEDGFKYKGTDDMAFIDLNKLYSGGVFEAYETPNQELTQLIRMINKSYKYIFMFDDSICLSEHSPAEYLDEYGNLSDDTFDMDRVILSPLDLEDFTGLPVSRLFSDGKIVRIDLYLKEVEHLEKVANK